MQFAELDDNAIVLQVIEADQTFIDAQSGNYVQSDPDGISPKNAAGIGYKWRQDLSGFVPPQQYPSWVLDTNLCMYVAPTPMPNDGHLYKWDEGTLTWIQTF